MNYTENKESSILNWEEIEKMLQGLLSQQKPNRLRILTDIFKSVFKLSSENSGTLNLKIVATAIRELRYSFKMFSPYRHIPKITMFGSAREPKGTPLYTLAKNFAELAVQRKYMIITGGGPGVMEAGNEGAKSDGGFGLNIRLPMEQSANPFIDQEKRLIHYKYFFTRKLFLVKEASAFCFFPGGVGTFDEAFEVLTLLQTGKMNLIPVALLEPLGFGFWTEVVKLMNTVMLSKGFIGEKDKHLYKLFHRSEDVLDYFDLFYKNFHSTRLVKENLVIRLRHPASDATVKEINKKFPALTRLGKIKSSPPLPEESNEPELMHLPRLVLPFDRRDFGSIRQLIDFLNQEAV